jgi:T5orf172 domain
MPTIVLSFPEYVVVLVVVVVVTVQRARLGRKSPHTPQKLKAGNPQDPLPTENLYKALPFLCFSPAATNFRCIWPCTTSKRKKCENPIGENRPDRHWANTLRNTIADDSPYSERVRAMLWEYAEYCLCKNHRPKVLETPAVIEDWVQQWLAEIRTLYDSMCDGLGRDDGTVGEGVVLFQQTTVPEARSEDESPNVKGPTPTNTRLKREASEEFTPTKHMPGTFPGDETFSSSHRKAVTIRPSPSARGSSTPGKSSPGEYSETIRNSPLGVERIRIKRQSSAPPKLGSEQGAKFEAYPERLKRTLLSVLTTPLGTDERQDGHVYIFTRRSNEDSHGLYVKIGVSVNVTDRLRDRKVQCKYKPHLEYQTVLIPNAMRVELLVHTELFDCRYRENQCSGCGGAHDEWFKTDVGTARTVVEGWAKWMQECLPYTQENQLSSHIVKGIFEHGRSKDNLTCGEMLALASKFMAVQPAQQSPPDNTEGRRTSASMDSLDPLSPTSRKSTFTGTITDLNAASEDEDDFEPIHSRPPWLRNAQMPSRTKCGNINIKKTRKSTGPAKGNLEQPASAPMAEFEEAKVKLEPKDDDLNDLFVSAGELTDSQRSCNDAECFIEQLFGMHTVKEEFGFSSIAQDQIKSGSPGCY